jgi:hypothetical protein
MNKYNIEGDIDFFTELYKSLDIEENEQKTEEDNDLCLITNQPLTDNYVKLDCGHKFNYCPLYQDIKNHKEKYNIMERRSSRLALDEIRCPYCRTKQKGVLPYYEEFNLEKVNGVNYVDYNIQMPDYGASNFQSCKFKILNHEYDPSGNNPCKFDLSNCGNCKYFICLNDGTKINYKDGYYKGDNYGDEKHYCQVHKKEIVKIYKKEKYDKIVEEMKQIKLLKEEKKQEVVKEKLKIKDDKLKLKEEKEKMKVENKKIKAENIVLGPMILTNMAIPYICTQILKSGINKGKLCGCKIIIGDKCGRHFNS